ncbi:MAG: aminoacyl-tRNA hydrolase [Phycisphaerales bacterium]|nr:aminoacyl-tRNA hydrolase [Planctomycetota bacterium]MCH8507495.1 aminoacyl-tRNA hydrolase [Phycisphaerales bacterium]
MKLIVGLGNPGAQYERTRHNAGFLALDELARRHAAGMVPRARFNAVTLDASIGGEKVLLAKPTTFMNLSGRTVGEAVRFFKLDPSSDVLVIVDEVALPVGTIRIREKGSAGGHNGLADIDRALGGADYPRLRIGVGAVPPGWVKADWVLSRFGDEELDAVRAGTAEAADAAECVVREGISAAMNRFNKKITQESKPGPDAQSA